MEAKMEIRKLKPEENVQRELMASICFLDQEPEDRYPWLKNPLEHTEMYEHTWGCFNDKGRLDSSLLMIPALMMINGQAVKTGFAAGVITLPEARRGGGIRKIYEKAFPAMKEEGVVFSFVYPFSFSYYRKFGYEQSYSRYKASISLSALSIYPYPSGVEAYQKGDACADFVKVYEAFIADKNLAIKRNQCEWGALLDRDPHLRREFTYIHYNAQGEPDAYVLYEAEATVEKYEHILAIKELVWSDISGLHSMLGFIYGLRSEYQEVTWEAPNCLDIFGLVKESWDVSVKWVHGGMNRIINLPRALELIKAPVGQGSVTLSVHDQFLPFNNGKYRITWESGAVSVEKTQTAPDVETSIEILTQMMTGYLTPAQVLGKKDLSVYGKMDMLSALFPPKHLYMMELY